MNPIRPMRPSQLFALRQAHVEALAMNAAFDAARNETTRDEGFSQARREQFRRVFGFVPRAKWTKAQKTRAGF